MEDRKYIVDVLKGTGIGLIVGSHILKISAKITLIEQLHTFFAGLILLIVGFYIARYKL